MSTHPSPLNPSQAVERIREIIVGRHLERLELRVARLEVQHPGATPGEAMENRLLLHEAHLEALQQNVQRLAQSTREEAELRAFHQREETQRLAAQIQQVAAAKAIESQPVRQLEQKIGHWLAEWQQSFQRQLDEREERITTRLHGDLAALWESTEAHITRVESQIPDRAYVEERFQRIAHAARALADCASSLAGNGLLAR